MAGTGTGPGHFLGADTTAAPAVDPGDLGLEEAPGRPEIQVAPAAHRAVVDGPGPPPARAAALGPPPTEPDHDPFRGEGDGGHRGADAGPTSC